jgi:hypothetical protein
MISATVAISPVPGDALLSSPGPVTVVTINRDDCHIVFDPIATKLHPMIIPSPPRRAYESAIRTRR